MPDENLLKLKEYKELLFCKNEKGAIFLCNIAKKRIKAKPLSFQSEGEREAIKKWCLFFPYPTVWILSFLLLGTLTPLFTKTFLLNPRRAIPPLGELLLIFLYAFSGEMSTSSLDFALVS